MKVVTTEEDFWTACPSAGAIMRYVAKLPQLRGITWEFGKAIIRPGHTTALFICAVHEKGHQELWVSATANDHAGWTLQHTPLS